MPFDRDTRVVPGSSVLDRGPGLHGRRELPFIPVFIIIRSISVTAKESDKVIKTMLCYRSFK